MPPKELQLVQSLTAIHTNSCIAKMILFCVYAQELRVFHHYKKRQRTCATVLCATKEFLNGMGKGDYPYFKKSQSVPSSFGERNTLVFCYTLAAENRKRSSDGE